MGYHDRATAGQRDLSTVGVTAEGNGEGLLAEVKKSGWGMHKHQPQRAGSRERARGVGSPGGVVVDSAQAYTIEWRGQSDTPVDEDLDTRGGQPRGDGGGAGPMVVIPEDRVPAERSRDPGETLRDELGSFRPERYEITAEQEEVGRLRFQDADGIGKDLMGGYRADVEIGGEGDPEHIAVAERLAQGELMPLHLHVG